MPVKQLPIARPHLWLSENGAKQAFRPGDVVYIPQQKGLVVYWSTDSYGRFFYVTYPHWR